MGEAIYYLTAKFNSEEELKKVFPKIKKLIKQGQESQDFWQEKRNQGNQFKFWAEFQEKFPQVFDYLRLINPEDNNNALAGSLDFGYDEIPEIEGNELRFNAEVWHLASWDEFAEYLKIKFGAKKVSWFSDEYC